jgi:hypothetical protein
MPLETDFELLEGFLGLGKVHSFRSLKGFEQLIQPVVILFIEYRNSLLTHRLPSVVPTRVSIGPLIAHLPPWMLLSIFLPDRFFVCLQSGFNIGPTILDELFPPLDQLIKRGLHLHVSLQHLFFSLSCLTFDLTAQYLAVAENDRIA